MIAPTEVGGTAAHAEGCHSERGRPGDRVEESLCPRQYVRGWLSFSGGVQHDEELVTNKGTRTHNPVYYIAKARAALGCTPNAVTLYFLLCATRAEVFVRVAGTGKAKQNVLTGERTASAGPRELNARAQHFEECEALE